MPTTPLNVIDNRVLRSMNEDRESTVGVKLTASTFYNVGDLLGDSGVDGTLSRVPNSGGGTPKAIMPIMATTDASGNITYGTPTTATQFGATYPTVAVLTGGQFKTQDLTQAGPGNIHANFFVPGGPQNGLNAKLIGSTSKGIIDF